MTVRELYAALCRRFPATLSAEWDNDGLMLSPDPEAPVRHVLCTLDATQEALEAARSIGADVVLSHHPMIFRPLSSVTPDTPTGRRAILALSAGLSVLSFHTRADAAEGGVNDLLAASLGLADATPFGDGLGRIAALASPTPLDGFCAAVRASLGSPLLLVGDAHRPVLRVALVGGSGKDEISAAIATGADTLLSGRLSYETVNEAEELGINLIEAGHFYTEAPLMRHLAAWIPEQFPDVKTTYFDSCRVIVK